MSLTTDRKDPSLNKVKDDGQNESYLVLSQEELDKGFIRPLRDTYTHIGKRIELEGKIELLEDHLTEGNRQYYGRDKGYAAFLKYPESKLPVVGRFIKQDELDSFNEEEELMGGCFHDTTINSREIVENLCKRSEILW